VAKIDVSIETDEKPAPPPKHPNTCPECHSHYRDDELEQSLWVCAHCGHHFTMRARARIDSLADPGSFVEESADLHSEDPLGFFDLRPYTERLAEAEMSTGLADAMVIGQAAIGGRGCELAVMDFSFMGGSMGSVALMQLPKTVCAVEDLRDAGQSMISVMAHPTTGGVLASFATLGDVLIAEPGALMSFAGPRVVESITREKLSADFGLAEQNLRFGHVDAIVPRPELRDTLARLLRLFDASE
jgi:acetyl-CoA carboxylase carboxyl transferase subunit beta